MVQNVLFRFKIPVPHGYKSYSVFATPKGDYVIWSRDGKRFYLDSTKNSKLLNMPDMPFRGAREAQKYLTQRILTNDKFGIKIKRRR